MIESILTRRKYRNCKVSRTNSPNSTLAKFKHQRKEDSNCTRLRSKKSFSLRDVFFIQNKFLRRQMVLRSASQHPYLSHPLSVPLKTMKFKTNFFFPPPITPIDVKIFPLQKKEAAPPTGRSESPKLYRDRPLRSAQSSEHTQRAKKMQNKNKKDKIKMKKNIEKKTTQKDEKKCVSPQSVRVSFVGTFYIELVRVCSNELRALTRSHTCARITRSNFVHCPLSDRAESCSLLGAESERDSPVALSGRNGDSGSRTWASRWIPARSPFVETS